MLVELTSDNLAELIQANPKVVVQFSASWCGNCRIMKPKLPTFAAFVNGELLKDVQTNKQEVLNELIDEITNN